MTKTQGWLIVIILFVGVVLFMIRNSNESKSAVNRAVADDNICYDNFRNSLATEQESVAKVALDKCLEQSRLKNL